MKVKNLNILKIFIPFLFLCVLLSFYSCKSQDNEELIIQKSELEILEENLPYLESEESKLIREHNQKMLGFDPSKESEYRAQLKERRKKVWDEMGWKEGEYLNDQERKYVEEFIDPNNRKFQLYLMYNIYDIEHEGNTDLIRAYAEIIYNYDSHYIMRMNAIKRLKYIRNINTLHIIKDCITDYDSDVVITSVNIIYYLGEKELAYKMLYNLSKLGIIIPFKFFDYFYLNKDKEYLDYVSKMIIDDFDNLTMKIRALFVYKLNLRKDKYDNEFKNIEIKIQENTKDEIQNIKAHEYLLWYNCLKIKGN